MLFTEFDINVAKKVWQEDGQIIAAIKMAKKLLRKGMTIEEIAEITELTQEDILEIKASMKD
jgi:predicted transposase/invertase (TIGR01784 family)